MHRPHLAYFVCGACINCLRVVNSVYNTLTSFHGCNISEVVLQFGNYSHIHAHCTSMSFYLVKWFWSSLEMIYLHCLVQTFTILLNHHE